MCICKCGDEDYSGGLLVLGKGSSDLDMYMYIHVQYCLTIVNGYQDGFNKSFNIFLDVVAPAIVGNDILIGEVRWDFKSS